MMGHELFRARIRGLAARTFGGTLFLLGILSPGLPSTVLSWPTYIGLLISCVLGFQASFFLVGYFAKRPRIGVVFKLLAFVLAIMPGAGIVLLFNAVWSAGHR